MEDHKFDSHNFYCSGEKEHVCDKFNFTDLTHKILQHPRLKQNWLFVGNKLLLHYLLPTIRRTMTLTVIGEGRNIIFRVSYSL